EGGTETVHSLSAEGSYQIWRQHSLRVHYTISLLHSRDGQDSIINDIDFGDDYLNTQEIHFSPTLTMRIASGIAFRTTGNGGSTGSGGSGGSSNTGNSKFGLSPKLTVEVTKIWPTASWVGGVRKGITGSFGVAGPSDTTSFFTTFSLVLTRSLTMFTG